MKGSQYIVAQLQIAAQQLARNRTNSQTKGSGSASARQVGQPQRRINRLHITYVNVGKLRPHRDPCAPKLEVCFDNAHRSRSQVWVALPGASDIARQSQVQAQRGCKVQSRHRCNIARAHQVILHSATNSRRCRESLCAQSRHQIDLIAQRSQRAKGPDSQLLPSTRNQERVRVGTLYAVKSRGLVILVYKPHRHQQHTRAQVKGPPQHKVHHRLLDGNFALRTAGGQGVLKLDLGKEADAVGEVVAQKQDGAA